MMTSLDITTEQQAALWRVWSRGNDWWGGNRPKFNELFRSAVHLCGVDGCIMVNAGGMWLGIEPDGYVHS